MLYLLLLDQFFLLQLVFLHILFVHLITYSDTARKSITSVTCWASANWPLFVSPIESWRADGVGTTWVWWAEILWNEWSTADEGITSHIPRATANWSKTAQITVSSCSASASTWISEKLSRVWSHFWDYFNDLMSSLANSIITSWFASWALGVAVTFSSALSEWTS